MKNEVKLLSKTLVGTRKKLLASHDVAQEDAEKDIAF